MPIDVERLKNLTKEEILQVLQDETTPTFAEAGLLVTRDGALMVRVGAGRWPIAMYKRDWVILLSKVNLIREALATLPIKEVNPKKVQPADRPIEKAA